MKPPSTPTWREAYARAHREANEALAAAKRRYALSEEELRKLDPTRVAEQGPAPNEAEPVPEGAAAEGDGDGDDEVDGRR